MTLTSQDIHKKFENLYQKGYVPKESELASYFHSDERVKVTKWYESIVLGQFWDEILIMTQAEQRIFYKDTPLSKEIFLLTLELFCSKHHVDWNYQKPFVSFSVYLPQADQKFRITLIHGSCKEDSCPGVYIRNLNFQNLHWANFDAPELLVNLLKKQKNILICGATGSGKTALLNVMIRHIPTDEHVVIMEDTHELMTRSARHTHLLASDQAQGFSQGKSLSDYCSYAMRISPQRIIIGEMRSKEVIPFLLAMNTGHKGMMATIHSNSAVDAIHRMGVLYSLHSGQAHIPFETIMRYLCQNVDYVCFVQEKKVREIISVTNYSHNQIQYEKVFSAQKNVNLV